MSYFFKHVLRKVFKNRSSYIGGTLVISLGILIFVSMFNLVANMKEASEIYYKDYKFADIFARVNSIPYYNLKDIENIDGIKTVDGKLAADVRLIMNDNNNVISLHTMSYDKESQILNRFKISDKFIELNDNDILIGNQMFNAYKFSIGDKIKIIINGKSKEFSIVGTLQSPEYIIIIPPTSRLPDSRTYDIACIDKLMLENLLNKRDIVNELSFQLEDNYKFSDVKSSLEEKLSKYGLISLEESKEQISNKQLQIQIDTFNNIAITLPILFLIISVFMLYIILQKMVDQDRSIIGTLKAFGFEDSEIFKVYIRQGIIIGFLGAVLGCVLATPLSIGLFNIVINIYNIPNEGFKIYVSSIFIGLVVSIVTSTFATYFGVKVILNINPAESMGLKSPINNQSPSLPYIINRMCNSKQIMSIRYILRNRLRSLVISLSIAFSFSLITVLISFLSLQEKLIIDHYNKVQTYDLKINTYNYTTYNNIISSVEFLDGVYSAEAISEYNVKIKNKNISLYSNLICLNKGSKLYKITDTDGNFYEPIDMGLIIGSTLSKKLGVKEGDTIEIENFDLTLEPIKIPVLKIIDETFGSSCYIDIDSLPKYFNINKSSNSVIFNVQRNKIDEIVRHVSL